MEHLAHLLPAVSPRAGAMTRWDWSRNSAKPSSWSWIFGAKGGIPIGSGSCADMPGIVIPQVFWEYSARVLTIEYMVGQGLREALSHSTGSVIASPSIYIRSF